MRAPTFILPVTVIIRGVEHAGTYDVEGDELTVYYAQDKLTVALSGAPAKKRATEVLAALVKRRRGQK